MRFLFFLFTKRCIVELFLILFFSFGLFCFDFGGLPTEDWIALNIIPLTAGFFTWFFFEILVFVLNINKAKYYCIILISIPICIMFSYLLKKI
jgi:hypothetical protein